VRRRSAARDERPSAGRADFPRTLVPPLPRSDVHLVAAWAEAPLLVPFSAVQDSVPVYDLLVSVFVLEAENRAIPSVSHAVEFRDLKHRLTGSANRSRFRSGRRLGGAHWIPINEAAGVGWIAARPPVVAARYPAAGRLDAGRFAAISAIVTADFGVVTRPSSGPSVFVAKAVA
jgi:hypothetical protein